MKELSVLRRRVVLGPYAKGILEGLDSIVNSDEYLKVLPRIDVANSFYIPMIQHGVEAFDVYDFHEDSILIPQSHDLAGRVFLHKYDKIEGQIRNKVWKLFEQFVPLWMISKNCIPVHTLGNFLEELLIAARSQKSVVTLLPVPDIQELQGLIRTELLLPIKNFLLYLRSEEVDGPAPLKLISSETVSQFRKIINSDVFHEFASAHASLDSLNVNVNEAKDKVLRTGKNIVQRYAGIVAPKRLFLRLFSVTQEVIETMSGKLGETLTKVIAPILTDVLKAERRLVIYEMTQALDDLVKSRRADFESATG